MALTRCALAAALASFVVAAPLAAQAGTGIVTGRVIDSASQQPLVSATIRVVGTTSGTLTRNDGTYTLSGLRPGAQTLRVTRIGFAAQTRPVTVAAGASVTADFILVSQAAVAQRRRDHRLRHAAARVDHRLGLDRQRRPGQRRRRHERQPAPRRAASPACSVTSNNGEPGGGAQIRIRGGTSISASNDPLYVVDGVPLQNENDRGRRGDQRRQRRRCRATR